MITRSRVADLAVGAAIAAFTFTVARADRGPDPFAGLPVIERIDVEKTSLCAGEDALVSVFARGGGGQNAELEVRIDRTPGTRRLVRADRADRGRTKSINVAVFDRQGRADARVAEIRVGHCDAAPRLRVEAELSQTWDGEVTFTATPFANGLAGTRSAPGTYVWNFGDGSRAQTTAPSIRHGYGRRSRGGATSDYVIDVTFRDEHGQRLSGRTSVGFANDAFTVAKNPVPALRALRDLDSGGRPLSNGVVLQHSLPSGVVLNRAAILARFWDGTWSPPEPIDPRRLVDPALIPPGPGALLMTSSLLPRGMAAVQVRLAGQADDGRPLLGRFTVEATDYGRAPRAQSHSQSEPAPAGLLHVH